MATDSTEREELQALVESRGWAYFVSQVTRELDSEYLDKMDRLLQGGLEKADEVRMMQLSAMRNDRKQLVKWPERRLAQLRAKTPDGPAVPEGSRRGRL